MQVPHLKHKYCYKKLVALQSLVCFLDSGKIFQKRNVSSPDPVTTVDPSGESARYKTLCTCSVKLASF